MKLFNQSAGDFWLRERGGGKKSGREYSMIIVQEKKEINLLVAQFFI